MIQREGEGEEEGVPEGMVLIGAREKLAGYCGTESTGSFSTKNR